MKRMLIVVLAISISSCGGNNTKSNVEAPGAAESGLFEMVNCLISPFSHAFAVASMFGFWLIAEENQKQVRDRCYKNLLHLKML